MNLLSLCGVRSLCAGGYFCNVNFSTTPTPSQNICPVGYACPAGSVNGTGVPCGVGYFCPPGTANAIGTFCYAVPTFDSGWARAAASGKGSTPGLTLLAIAPSGVIAMTNSTTGTDVNCNRNSSSPVVPAVITSVGLSTALLGDVNGDGFADVVGVTNNGSTVVLMNDAKDNWSANGIVWVLPNVSSSRPASSVVLLDSSGDGRVDILAIVTSLGSSVLMLASYKQGVTFTEQPGLNAVAVAQGIGNANVITAFDANGDGLVDVVAATTAGCALLLNRPTYAYGWFSSPAFSSTTPCSTALCLAVGDVRPQSSARRRVPRRRVWSCCRRFLLGRAHEVVLLFKTCSYFVCCVRICRWTMMAISMCT